MDRELSYVCDNCGYLEVAHNKDIKNSHLEKRDGYQYSLQECPGYENGTMSKMRSYDSTNSFTANY